MTKLNEFPQAFEPKKENRFIVKFGEPFHIPEWTVKQAQRPSFANTRRGIEWNNIVFTMYDPITPSTSHCIMEGLRELRKQDSQTIDVIIQEFGPVGDTVGEWKITGKINSVDFGQLDWNSDEALTIRLHLNVHSAVLNY